jgi:hypothetical protein
MSYFSDQIPSLFGYCRAFDQVERIWASFVAALLYGIC